MLAKLEQRARPHVDHNRRIALGHEEPRAAGAGIRAGRAATEDGELHRTGAALSALRCVQSLNR